MGLKKKIASDTFMSVTYLMMDAMAPVTILSQFFQTENVDVALVKVKLELCLKDQEAVKGLDTPYLQKLREDVPVGSSTFRDTHIISRCKLNLQKLTDEFIDTLISNIKSRFPDNDILSAFSIFSMRPLSFLNASELEEYGQEEITKLCAFYGSSKTAVWKEDGVEHSKTSEAIIAPDKTVEEWQTVKKVVKAEQYPRDQMWKLWYLINKFHKEEYPKLCSLAVFALTCCVHTAGCERGFPVQNRILTTFIIRNRLTVDKQRKLMLVKIDGGERSSFNFDRCLQKFKETKPRRLYEMKLTE